MINNQKKTVIDNAFFDQYDSDQWEKRRNEILDIDGHKCKRCGISENLQVHHKHYVNGRNAWEYDDHELVTLCISCHQEVHHYKSEINKCLFSLMDTWCHQRATPVSDYYDALQILQHLSLLGGKDSRIYANLCISAGMSFVIGGD